MEEEEAEEEEEEEIIFFSTVREQTTISAFSSPPYNKASEAESRGCDCRWGSPRRCGSGRCYGGRRSLNEDRWGFSCIKWLGITDLFRF